MKLTAKCDSFPMEVTEGSSKVTIYRQVNPSRRRNPDTQEWEPTGKVFDEYVLAYYSGLRDVLDKTTGQPRQVPKLVRKKFADLAEAQREARFVVNRLANAEGEVLKLSGLDRLAYVDAMQELRQWRPDARLSRAIADYTAAMKRLPDGVPLAVVVEEYLKRHPSGLQVKTVRQVMDEMIATKAKAGRSQAYVTELEVRLGRFAKAFAVPIATVTGRQVQEWIHGLGLGPRSQNNFSRVVRTLFGFARARSYVPRDFDELDALEWADDDGGEIEIFTPTELRQLFDACARPVIERGQTRDRSCMIPYLAIAAFAGLRAAEIKRLDWSEVHLTGPEKFIEVKASKAKTASRRIVPILDNLAEWLAPFAQSEGPLVPYERTDKQLFEYLGPAAGVPWKRNGLRHSFISYRVAIINDVGQVALEAGNSPQMVFRNYRQLTTQTQAKDWFALRPPSGQPNIIAYPGLPAGQPLAPEAPAAEAQPLTAATANA